MDVIFGGLCALGLLVLLLFGGVSLIGGRYEVVDGPRRPKGAALNHRVKIRKASGKISQLAFALVGAVSLLTIADPVQAEVTVQEWKSADPEHKQAYRFYISGLENAFGLANVDNEMRGLAPLYCPPEHLGLTADQVEYILESQIEFEDAMGLGSEDWSLSLVLLQGLRRVFPCEPAKGGQ